MITTIDSCYNCHLIFSRYFFDFYFPVDNYFRFKFLEFICHNTKMR